MTADETRCPLTATDITLLGDPALPVVPGKPFADLKEEGLPPELSPGMGDDMPYPGSHLICNPDAKTVSADTMGMVVADETGLEVIPLWTISEDRLTMTMTVHPTDCFGTLITADNYRDWLPEGCHDIDDGALDAAVAEAHETEAPVEDTIIARGVAPVDGREGQIKMSFERGNDVGTQQSDGSINYRERGKIACVMEGEHIASLLPPTAGKPGCDVLGKELPAKDGTLVTLKAGAGVSVAGEEGTTQVFTATVTGMVVLKEDLISVSDVLEIDSDVDINSGNIHVDKGSILIKGTVTTGAEVSARDNVSVEVVVENATIKAGNDVAVGGGVLMDEGGLIKAGGNVSAKFFRNATIRAGGDVVADVDFVNCDIIARGKVISESDKGVVNGGTYKCGGMNVSEVGSDVGATSEVMLAMPDADDTDLDGKLQALQSRVEELQKYIGADDAAAALLAAPKGDRAILAELFKAKALMLAQVRDVEEEKQQRLVARSKALARIGVTARKKAHAGTAIKIGNKTLKLKKPVQASTIHWDPEHGGITISDIVKQE